MCKHILEILGYYAVSLSKSEVTNNSEELAASRFMVQGTNTMDGIPSQESKNYKDILIFSALYGNRTFIITFKTA
jgi:hypothetical protein